jgi:hypothetical protein
VHHFSLQFTSGFVHCRTLDDKLFAGLIWMMYTPRIINNSNNTHTKKGWNRSTQLTRPALSILSQVGQLQINPPAKSQRRNYVLNKQVIFRQRQVALFFASDKSHNKSRDTTCTHTASQALSLALYKMRQVGGGGVRDFIL